MTDRTPRERAALRRYAAELAAVITVLLALLLIPSDAVAPDGPDTLRTVWALLPTLPAVGIVVVVARYLRRVDELQRRIVVGALAVGFAVSMLAALTTAFARSAGVAVGESEWTVFLAGMAAFAVAVAVGSWRGR